MTGIRVLFNSEDNRYTVSRDGVCSFYEGLRNLPNDIIEFLIYHEPKFCGYSYTLWEDKEVILCGDL